MDNKFLKPKPGFDGKGIQKDRKNGFANNPKPNYKAKGSATKLTSHRRGKV